MSLLRGIRTTQSAPYFYEPKVIYKLLGAKVSGTENHFLDYFNVSQPLASFSLSVFRGLLIKSMAVDLWRLQCLKW